jgi:hypothetical protein
LQGTGLPDGISSYQKSLFGKIFEGIGMGNVGMVYGHLGYVRTFAIFCGHLLYFVVNWYIFDHLVYFVVICYILWSFGIFLVIWYILWSFAIYFVVICYIFPVLVYRTKKNLAILAMKCRRLEFHVKKMSQK